DVRGLAEIEPHARGLAALHAPSGGIASGRIVTQALAEEARGLGVEFCFGARVTAMESSGTGYRIHTTQGSFQCERLINAAGLHADSIAHMMGVGLNYTIIPFRGEYYRLEVSKAHLLRSMVYPVPDLAYPFLGVHWTRHVDGTVLIGPSARKG